MNYRKGLPVTFTIYGLEDNAPELMPVKKLFKQGVVKKVEASAKVRTSKDKGGEDASEQHERQHPAAQAYKVAGQLPVRPSVLLAEQVMSAPVVTLAPGAMISEALLQFRENAFRHLPVVSSAGRLVGIVSERDILRRLAGLTASYQPQASTSQDSVQVEQIMTPKVLTASVDTDVRYIARLFVEQRIGAMPVVRDHVLHGIITRSDVLRAVMRHYVLELWA